MAGTFIVQMDKEEFRIVGPDGEIGPEVPYGEEGGDAACAMLVIGDDVYMCRVDDVDAETQSVEQVTQTRLMTTTIEEVAFADDNDEDEDGGGDGGDDDDGETVEVVEEPEEEHAA